jgi:hypothetical protein
LTVTVPSGPGFTAEDEDADAVAGATAEDEAEDAEVDAEPARSGIATFDVAPAGFGAAFSLSRPSIVK